MFWNVLDSFWACPTLPWLHQLFSLGSAWVCLPALQLTCGSVSGRLVAIAVLVISRLCDGNRDIHLLGSDNYEYEVCSLSSGTHPILWEVHVRHNATYSLLRYQIALLHENLKEGLLSVREIELLCLCFPSPSQHLLPVLAWLHMLDFYPSSLPMLRPPVCGFPIFSLHKTTPTLVLAPPLGPVEFLLSTFPVTTGMWRTSHTHLSRRAHEHALHVMYEALTWKTTQMSSSDQSKHLVKP